MNKKSLKSINLYKSNNNTGGIIVSNNNKQHRNQSLLPTDWQHCPPNVAQIITAPQGPKPSRNAKLLRLMSNLAQCQAVLSLLFIIFGVVRFGYAPDSPQHGRMCMSSVVAGSSGSTGGLVGVWATRKFRRHCLMVAYLVASVLCSVSYLVLLIHIASWMDAFQKIVDDEKNAAPIVFYMNFAFLLACVALGVCFILSSSFICHLWSPKNPRRKSTTVYKHEYKIVGLYYDQGGYDERKEPNFYFDSLKSKEAERILSLPAANFKPSQIVVKEVRS